MNKMGEDKKPVIVTPPDPLPKIEIPNVKIFIIFIFIFLLIHNL